MQSEVHGDAPSGGTVLLCFGVGGDPVVTRKPGDAWSHAVFDAACDDGLDAAGPDMRCIC